MAERGFQISRLPGFATVAIAAFVLLYLPIFTLVAFSFNASNSVAVWGGFSLHWYADAWANDDVKAATMRSLIIGASAAVLSTALATMAALGTTRRRAFKGQTFIYVVINQPLMVHEAVGARMIVWLKLTRFWLSAARAWTTCAAAAFSAAAAWRALASAVSTARPSAMS